MTSNCSGGFTVHCSLQPSSVGARWLVPDNRLWLKRRGVPPGLLLLWAWQTICKKSHKVFPSLYCAPLHCDSAASPPRCRDYFSTWILDLGLGMWLALMQIRCMKSFAYWGSLSYFSLEPWNYHVRKTEKDCWKMRGYKARSFHQLSHPSWGLKYVRKTILDHPVLAEPAQTSKPAQPAHWIMKNKTWLFFKSIKIWGGLLPSKN